VYPILLHEPAVIRSFLEAVSTPVNIFAAAPGPSNADLAVWGVARISYGTSIHRRTMRELATYLEALRTNVTLTE
jgi:2-methylisocitrate lyase-like PEP mutase family enzyme